MSAERKKILWITWELPYFPGGGGGSTRQFCLLRELSRHHNIYLVTAVEPKQLKYIEPIKKYCKLLRWHLNRRGRTRELAYSLLIRRGMPAILKKLPFKYTFLFYLQMMRALFDPKPLQYYHAERVWDCLRSSVSELLERERFDIIHLEHSDIAHWAVKFQNQPSKTITAQNIKSVMHLRYAKIAATLPKRFLALVSGIKFFFYERKYLRQFSKVFVTSEHDCRLLKRIEPAARASVITNGVDTDYFKDIIDFGPGQDLCRAAFIGSLHYPPNLDGCFWFIQKILPLLNHPHKPFFLDIAGLNAPESLLQMQSSNIKIYSNADDVRPIVKHAAFFVVPLRSGSGTRLKILDAMAMGKTVISTTLGAEGIQYTQNENIIIANTESEFVKEIQLLQSQPERLRKIGSNARRFVENHYDWKLIGEKFRREIEAVTIGI